MDAAAEKDNASSASKICETANILALPDSFNPIDRAVTNILGQGDEESWRDLMGLFKHQ
jgi:hypothetical protein